MYSIKNKPEDFVVIEKNKKLEKEYKKNMNDFSKKYLIFKLKKIDIDSFNAITTLSHFFKINKKDIGIAGIKDKKAITEQYISIKNYNRIRNRCIANKEIKINEKIILLPLFSREQPIFKGFLDGNFFEIFVKTKKRPIRKKYFLNYFGEQRFSKSNVQLGRYLIKRDYNEFIKHFNKNFIGNNFVNWINKNIDSAMVLFYIHSYQSFIWNKAVEKIFLNKKHLGKYKELEIPLIGFEAQQTEMTKDMIQKYNEIIKKERITPRDFIFSDLLSASSAGDKRKAVAIAENLKILKKEKGYLIKFFLQKGSYATVFINQLMKR